MEVSGVIAAEATISAEMLVAEALDHNLNKCVDASNKTQPSLADMLDEQNQLYSSPERSKATSKTATLESPTGVDHLYEPEVSVDLSMQQLVLKDKEEEEYESESESEEDDDDDSYDEEHEQTTAARWSQEVQHLTNCQSAFEAVTCLRRISSILQDVDDEDRVRFCKGDFEASVETLEAEGFYWWDELCAEVIGIKATFFDESMFQYLPEHLIMDIFLWIPVEESASVVEVCSEWNDLGTRNDVWRTYYSRKFLTYNPNSLPLYDIELGFRYLFQVRLRSPQCGDRVEVAWRGKFRLEEHEVYSGLAWWVAQVVDVHQELGRYKIRYLGWDAHWDDWIPRDRLRWVVEGNTVEKIRQGDQVELWCIGANVPGAWLETKVTKVEKKSRYYLAGQAVSREGPVWVRRDRLRLIRRGPKKLTRAEKELQKAKEVRVVDEETAALIRSQAEQVGSPSGNSQRRISFPSLGGIGRMLSRRMSSQRDGQLAPPSPDRAEQRQAEAVAGMLTTSSRSLRRRDSDRDRDRNRDRDRDRDLDDDDRRRDRGLGRGRSSSNGRRPDDGDQPIQPVRHIRDSSLREVRVSSRRDDYDRDYDRRDRRDSDRRTSDRRDSDRRINDRRDSDRRDSDRRHSDRGGGRRDRDRDGDRDRDRDYDRSPTLDNRLGNRQRELSHVRRGSFDGQGRRGHDGTSVAPLRGGNAVNDLNPPMNYHPTRHARDSRMQRESCAIM